MSFRNGENGGGGYHHVSGRINPCVKVNDVIVKCERGQNPKKVQIFFSIQTILIYCNIFPFLAHCVKFIKLQYTCTM